MRPKVIDLIASIQAQLVARRVIYSLYFYFTLQL